MDGQTALKWLDEAAEFSEPGPGVTRMFLSDQHRALIDWLQQKAKSLDLDCTLDDSGNFVMRRPSTTPNARTLLIGSHQDSVRNGGKYDGMLGIIAPMLTLARMEPLPYHVEVIAFGDEEGVRFSSTLIGSSAIAGEFDQDILPRKDRNNIAVRDAMALFGLNPDNISSIARDPATIMGFLEMHIEQGPILEEHNAPVGLVTALTGIERHKVTIKGRAGHAGTVPMHLRDDALVKAATLVTQIHKICSETEGLVGVIGELEVKPNAVNVIPAQVDLTIELRAPDDQTRHTAREQILSFLNEINGATSQCVYQKSGFYCDPQLVEHIEHAIAAQGHDVIRLFSGAGHDGLAMHRLTPSAMIFVRCKDGLSHHPDEAITSQDCAIAMNVLEAVLQRLAQTPH